MFNNIAKCVPIVQYLEQYISICLFIFYEQLSNFKYSNNNNICED